MNNQAQGNGHPPVPPAGAQGAGQGATPPAAQPAQPQPVAPQAAPAPATPVGAQPVAAQPAADTPPTPPAPVVIDPNATGTLNIGGDKHYFVIPPHPNTQFDEEYFLKLLEGSISLTLGEKQKVIDAIPRLSIEQINELIKIFEEEKEKFKELESQYGDDVAKLKQQREAEFKIAESRQEEESEADEEAAAAEELKRKLMGGGR